MRGFAKKSFGRGRFWRYAPLVFWIAVILIASSNMGSMSNTSRVIRPILEFIFPGYGETELAEIHAFIRKTAHFTFYGMLGWLAARAFGSSTKLLLQKNRILFSLSLVITVAAIDETNQSFLPSRTGSVYDVLIDTAGGLTAIIFWLFLSNRGYQR